jgi:exosortase/archaeosortase
MAIYHFSVKAISRGDGRSAVACAAYRSGEKLVCDYYGKEQDYTKKQVLNLQIFMHLKIQIQIIRSSKIVECSRKSSAEKMLYLPVNLKLPFQRIEPEQRQALLDELCQEL